MSGSAGDAGIYTLLIRLARSRRIRVGSLGLRAFPAGYYLYTGSARRHLAARVARHFRRCKTRRWHVDYLLRYARVEAVRVWPGERNECRINRFWLERPGAGIPVPGFGSSDCRCRSHLVYMPEQPSLEPEE